MLYLNVNLYTSYLISVILFVFLELQKCLNGSFVRNNHSVFVCIFFNFDILLNHWKALTNLT